MLEKRRLNSRLFYFSIVVDSNYSGMRTGVIGSLSVPLGNSPFDLRIFASTGNYKNSDSIQSIWENAGLILQMHF